MYCTAGCEFDMLAAQVSGCNGLTAERGCFLVPEPNKLRGKVGAGRLLTGRLVMLTHIRSLYSVLVASPGTFKASSHFFLTTTFPKGCHSGAHLAAVTPRLRGVQQLAEVAPPRRSGVVHIAPAQARELHSDPQISPDDFTFYWHGSK